MAKAKTKAKRKAPVSKKQADSRFKPGQSGNPNGRPLGAKNKITRAIKDLVESEIDRRGPEGLAKWAEENETEFWKIAAKLLPNRTELTGAEGGPVQVNGTNVPPPAATLDDWLEQHGDDDA